MLLHQILLIMGYLALAITIDKTWPILRSNILATRFLDLIIYRNIGIRVIIICLTFIAQRNFFNKYPELLLSWQSSIIFGMLLGSYFSYKYSRHESLRNLRKK